MKRLVALALAWICGLVALAQSPGKFVATGEMTSSRAGHTATLLKDGRVLITGGYQQDARGKGTDLASAELYDPSTGTFTPTGDMTTSREWHSATLLPDGHVLIVGGLPEANGYPSSSEVYDPATGIFTRSGNMTAAHVSHSANLLGNGKVLITGYPTAELYDPATGVFTPEGSAKNYLGTALLNDGKILIASYGDVSLYEVTGDSLKLLTNWPGSKFYYQTATVLANGKVLIAGGEDDYGEITSDEPLLFDPRPGTLESIGLMLLSRVDHTATLLPGGRVLIAGGYSSGGYSSGIPAVTEAEEYDPSTGSFTYAGNDKWLRDGPTATLLPDGTVLIAGGTSDTAAAELYIPPLRAASSASLTGPLSPESQASLFGSRLAGATESANPASPPTSLGGIGLRVVDSSGTERMAPLFYVSPSQIKFEVPAGTAAGKVTLEVVNSPSQINQATAQIDNVAPALFTHNDNTAVAYTTRFERRIPSDNRPVQLILYATGIRNRSSLANVQCTIGGISVPVDYAGPNENGVPGLDQVNVSLIPTLKGGFADLVLTVDSIPSNTVSVNIVGPGRN